MHGEIWRGYEDLNLNDAVLETGVLPLELYPLRLERVLTPFFAWDPRAAPLSHVLCGVSAPATMSRAAARLTHNVCFAWHGHDHARARTYKRLYESVQFLARLPTILRLLRH